MALYRQQWKRDTAGDFTSANDTLLAGEPAFETDTSLWKIGDGTTAWNDLAYMNPVPFVSAWLDYSGANALKNVTATITHNLGYNITGLEATVYFSATGADTDARDITDMNVSFYFSATPETYGIELKNIDTNSFTLQTGATGLMLLTTAGGVDPKTAGYLKVVTKRR